MVKQAAQALDTVEVSKADKSTSVINNNGDSVDNSSEIEENLEDATSKYYNVGDPVDYRMGAEEGSDGAWFESEVIRITKKPNSSSSDSEDDLVFHLTVLR